MKNLFKNGFSEEYCTELKKFIEEEKFAKFQSNITFETIMYIKNYLRKFLDKEYVIRSIEQLESVPEECFIRYKDTVEFIHDQNNFYRNLSGSINSLTASPSFIRLIVSKPDLVAEVSRGIENYLGYRSIPPSENAISFAKSRKINLSINVLYGSEHNEEYRNKQIQVFDEISKPKFMDLYNSLISLVDMKEPVMKDLAYLSVESFLKTNNNPKSNSYILFFQ